MFCRAFFLVFGVFRDVWFILVVRKGLGVGRFGYLFRVVFSFISVFGLVSKGLRCFTDVN